MSIESREYKVRIQLSNRLLEKLVECVVQRYLSGPEESKPVLIYLERELRAALRGAEQAPAGEPEYTFEL